MRGALADPFFVDPPAAASVRARLWATAADEAVLWEVGRFLGSALCSEVAARCAMGAGRKHFGRAGRKRALTPSCSSRWAGSVTRVAGDMWERGFENLVALAARDRVETAEIERRLVLPTGVCRCLQPRGREPGDRKEPAERKRRCRCKRKGAAAGKAGRRARGFASPAERYEKQRRSQKLEARLADTGRRIAAGDVSITVGGRKLARNRSNLEAAGITAEQWREQWDAKRVFLTADGESAKKWGNETIRVFPDTSPTAGEGDCTVEVRLPSALAHLSNTPGRSPVYRLAGTVKWNHLARDRGVRALAGEAIGYTISPDPDKDMWTISAAWSLPQRPPPEAEPGAAPAAGRKVVGIDTNAGHLDARVVDEFANPVGRPKRVAVAQAGTAAQREGAVREAMHHIFAWASERGAAAAAMEKLDFQDIRTLGRHTFRRGKAGRATRQKVCGIPTAKTSRAASSASRRADMALIAVDAAYTSIWGKRWWEKPLNQSRRQQGDGHQAAAVVIGRRSQRHGPKRKTASMTATGQRTGSGELPPSRPPNIPGMAPTTGNDRREQHHATTVCADP